MTVSRKFFRCNSIKFFPTVRSFKELFLKILLPGGEMWSISWNSSGFYAIIWYLWNIKIALLTHLDSLLKNVALILTFNVGFALRNFKTALINFFNFIGSNTRISCFFTKICMVDGFFFFTLFDFH
jgi:hypothetical protein